MLKRLPVQAHVMSKKTPIGVGRGCARPAEEDESGQQTGTCIAAIFDMESVLEAALWSNCCHSQFVFAFRILPARTKVLRLNFWEIGMKNDPIVEDARKARIAFAARHGVPEVWVIDLENALVHFHRRPGGGMYTTFPPRSAPA